MQKKLQVRDIFYEIESYALHRAEERGWFDKLLLERYLFDLTTEEFGERFAHRYC